MAASTLGGCPFMLLSLRALMSAKEVWDGEMKQDFNAQLRFMFFYKLITIAFKYCMVL